MRVEGLTGGVGVSVIWRGGNRGGLQQGATGQCKYAIAAAAAVGFGPKTVVAFGLHSGDGNVLKPQTGGGLERE